MRKLLILIFLSLPLVAIALSDEESQLRDSIVKEHENSPELDEKLDNLNSQLDNSFFGGMISDEIKAEVLKMITDNPFQYMSDEQVRELLVSKGGKSFAENPKLLAGTSEWIRDKEALPQFMSIIGEGEKLKTYGICFIVVFVCAFLLNLKNGKHSIFKRFMYKIGLMLITTTINFGIFYYLFQDNIDPTIKIVKKYLVS